MMIVTKVHQLIWDQGKLAANSSCSPLLLWPHRFILLHYVESSVLCSNIFERTPTSTIIAAGCVFCTCKMVCMFVCVHRRAAPQGPQGRARALGGSLWRHKVRVEAIPIAIAGAGQSKCNTLGTICSQHKFISQKGCKLQCFLSKTRSTRLFVCFWLCGLDTKH